jgi:lipid-A-disaccharide synthase
MKEIFILAAENSAEIYAAQIIREFKKNKPQLKFFGVGGDTLQELGVEIIIPSKEFAIVGILEVLSSLLKMKRYMNRLLTEIADRRPDAVFLIDFPDFNLRLAGQIKKMNIPVYSYISPTIWAWRYNRIFKIKQCIDHIFIIFPFEIEIFTKEKMSFTYTGHPLVPLVKTSVSRENWRKSNGIANDESLVLLLPGSRMSEIHKLLPLFLKAAKRLRQSQKVKIVLIKADNIDRHSILKYCQSENVPLEIINQSDRYNAISAADLALSTCGTSNLELALLGTPFVAVYQVNKFSYWLGRPLVKINLFSIVNILAGKQVIPELIQSDLNEISLFQAAMEILNNPEISSQMRLEFSKIKTMLEQNLIPAEIIYQKITADLEK